MMPEDFTQKELAEARSQLCFNICSHYDEKFSIKNPEKSIELVQEKATFFRGCRELNFLEFASGVSK